jgi:hypothetical protein
LRSAPLYPDNRKYGKKAKEINDDSALAPRSRLAHDHTKSDPTSILAASSQAAVLTEKSRILVLGLSIPNRENAEKQGIDGVIVFY